MKTSINKPFAPNIDARGRLLRAAGAVALIIGGCVALEASFTLALILFVSGAFVSFEALRGWCALRACGIKTRF